MTRIAKGLTILLLLAPLLLGAATSQKSKSSRDPAVNREAAKSTSSVVPAPTTAAAQPPATTPTPTGGGLGPSSVASPTLNYTITWSSINGGGTTNTSSTHYSIGNSLGQSAAGQASSTNFQMGIGFWYGAPPGGCSCPYQGDLDGSGAIDVQDVLAVIKIAFVNGTDVKDPLCPKTRGDVNNSGVVDVQDVLYIIKTAFTNGPNPVNPCGP